MALLVAGWLLLQAQVAAAYSGGPCTQGTTNYAGYESYGVPGNGGSASAHIYDNADQLFTSSNAPSPSHVAGFVDVENDSDTHWLKAGIYNDPAHGPILWIDYNTDGTGHHFVDESTASYEDSYFAQVSKVKDGNWNAQIGPYHVTGVPLSGMTKTYWRGASQTEGTTCNYLSMTFNSILPAGQTNAELQQGPYSVSNTPAGWASLGGGGGPPYLFEMPCSEGENPNLEYTPTSGYGIHAVLGLDHFGDNSSLPDTYLYVYNVNGTGQRGQVLTWNYAIGGVSLEGVIATGDPEGLYGQRYCPNM
jgi:hypothetical protein